MKEMKLGRKMIALVTVFLMVFGGLPLTALADADHPYYYDGLLSNVGTIRDSGGHEHTSALITLKEDNSSVRIPAYCSDLAHYLQKEHFSAAPLTDGHIRAIIYADIGSIISGLGLTNVSNVERAEAIQAAIWHFSDGLTLGTNNSANVIALYDKLISLPSEGARGNEQEATVSVELVSFDGIDGSGRVSLTFRYKCSSSSVTLTPAVAGGNGTLGTPTTSNGWHVVSVTNINPATAFTFSASGSQTVSHDACLYLPENSNDQKLVGFPHDESVTVSDSMAMQFGSIRIRKVFDGSANNAENFTVMVSGTGSLEGKVSRTVTVASNATNSNWVTVSGLPFGSYTVTETLSSGQKALYQNISIVNSDTSNNTVVVDATGSNGDVTVSNRKIGSIELHKQVDSASGADGITFHFTVTGPNNYSQTVDLTDGGSKTLGSLAYGDYTITETATDNFRLTSYSGGGGTRSGLSYTVTVGESNRDIVVTANNQKLGSLKINKTDSNTGKPVPGVKFHIAGPDFTGDKTTGDNGTVVIGGLTPGGSYTVTEVSTPADYAADAGSHPAQTIPAGGTATFNFSDTPVGYIKVIKQDPADNSVKLAGVTFEVSKNKDDFTGANIVATLTTGSDGTATSGKIETGTYWIRESNAPEGYVNDNKEPVQIEVKQGVDASNNTFTFSDRRYVGSLLIKKTSTYDGSPVAGVAFEVSRNAEFTDLVANLPNGGKTDAKGELLVINLKPGQYWVREVAPAPGYDIDRSVVRNVTVEFTKTAEADFANTPLGTVKVIKKDAFNGSALAGAVFGVYSDADCTKLVDTLAATDANGLATSKALPFGPNTIYYVKEISAPARYIADSSVKQAVFTTPGQVVELTFTNERNFGDLKVKKVLEGASGDLTSFTFKITGPSFPEGHTFQLSANEETPFYGLDFGTYVITELNVPAGYKLEGMAGGSGTWDGTSYTVVLGRQNQGFTVTATNRKLGSIDIKKQLLDGVTEDATKFDFTISGPGFSSQQSFSLASTEHKVFDNLEYGQYVITELPCTEGYAFASFSGGSGTGSGRTWTVTLGAANLNIAVTCNNQKLGRIEVVKTKADSSPVVYLAGAIFGVYSDQACKNLVETMKATDDNGKAESSWLRPGTYWVKELSAPRGYGVDSAVPVEAKVDPGTLNILPVFTDTQLHGRATFSKVVDNDANDAATFTLHVRGDNGYSKDVTVGQKLDPVTLNDLPFGTYTVTEDEKSGFEGKGIANGTFTIDETTYAGSPILVVATNHKLFGSAVFSKVVDNVTDDPATFTLKITGDNGYSKTVTVGEKLDPVTLNDLPFGHYTVTEDAKNGYEGRGITHNTFTIDASNYSGPATQVVATNHKLFGSAIFKKDVNNVGNDPAEFTLTITGDNGYSNTVTVGEKLDAVTLNDLPFGHYTVTEAAKTGYQTVEITNGTFTIDATTYKTAVTVTAVNHKLLGTVVFSKVVDNIENDPKVFTLRIIGDNGYTNSVTVSETGDPVTLDGLPFGTYTVTEDDATGYENKGISHSTFTIDAGNYAAAAIEVVATNHKLLGSATFSKVVDNDTNDAATFTLQVRGDNGYSKDVTVGQKISAVTLHDLPFGHYTVTEVAKAGYQSAGITHGTFTIDEGNYSGAAIEVAATNHKLYGSAVFKKDVNNVEDDATTFTLHITGDNGYTNTVTVGETLDPVTLNNLPFGHYTVTEDGRDGYQNVNIINGTFTIDNSTYKSAVSVTAENHKLLARIKVVKTDAADNSIYLKGAEFKISTSKTAFDANVVDTLTTDVNGAATSKYLPLGTYYVKETKAPDGYAASSSDIVEVLVGDTDYLYTQNFRDDRLYGKATFTKSVSNVENDDTEFTLNITGDNGYKASVKVGEKLAPAVLENLPFGHYTVTEDAKDQYKLDSITPPEFDVNAGSYATVTSVQVVNSKMLGSASFTKLVSNVDNDETTFTLKIQGDNGYSNTVTVGEMLKPAVLNDLPFGHYTVTEDAKTGYKLDGITPSEFDVTAESYATVKAVQIVNSKLFGSASFAKVVDNVTDDPATFTLRITGDNGYTNSVTVGEKLAPVVLNNLPFGHYTVTEDAKTGYQNLGIAHSTFTIDAGNYSGSPVEVTATNHKLYGSVVFSKVVDNVTDDPAEFTLRITGDNGYSNTVTVGEKLKPAALDGLPFGTYTVTEDAKDGYHNLGISHGTFTIDAGNYNTAAIEVVATNHKLFGSASFTKKVDNIDNDATTFTLNVTGDNGYKNTVTVGEMLKPAVLNDLPFGHYTVTEDAKEGYKLDSITPASFDVTAESYTTVKAVEAVNSKLLGSALFFKALDNVSNDSTAFTLRITGDNGYSNSVTVGQIFAPAELHDLPFGHYTVTEDAHDGYQALAITNGTFTIDATNYNAETPVYVTANNHKLQGRIKVLKTDAASPSTYLKGAEFKISTSNTAFDANVVDTITTGDDGTAMSKFLPVGTYFVKETKAPDGYAPGSSTAVEVKLEETDVVYSVPFSDSKLYGKASFVKSVDNIDNDATEFTLNITGDNGYKTTVKVGEKLAPAVLDNLPFGHYTVTEDAKDGYKLDSITPSEFDVNAGNYATVNAVQVVNSKLFGGVSFTKQVSNVDNDATEFTLNIAGDNGYKNSVTVGEMLKPAVLDNLPFGHYTVTESAKDGYKLDSITPAEFDVKADNYTTVQAVLAVNSKLFGGASFAKQVSNVDNDATEFTLNIAGDNGYKNSVTVGEMLKPVVLNNLPFGHYTVTESAKDGYKLDSITPAEFDVKADNYTSVQAVLAVNSKLFGGVSFTKQVSNVDNDATEFTLNIAGDNGYRNSVTVGEMLKPTVLNNLPFGHYTVTESAKDGYKLDSITPAEFDVKADNYTTVQAVLAVNSKLFGSASFTKQVSNVDNDATEFTLNIAGDNGYKNSVTVGELLKPAVLNNLPFGHYTVTESAKDGYKLDSITPAEFDVKADNYTTVQAVLAVNSKLLGSASFSKVIDNDSADDTQFTLHISSDTGYSNTVTVGQALAPVSLSGLPFGNYTVAEDAKGGYETVNILNEHFKIDATNYGGAPVQVVATNHKLMGRISAVKRDAKNSGLYLGGAVFSISTESGAGFDSHIVATMTTDATTGVAVSKLLPIGTYYVKETTAPNGYVIDDTAAREARVANGETYQLPVFTDTKYEGSLLIRKFTTFDHETPVAGVQFQVATDAAFTHLVSLPNGGRTDAKGELLVQHLVPGATYWVREIDPAPGYDIDRSLVQSVTVVFNTAAAVRFENSPVGYVQVTKLDSADRSLKLAGAVFGVYSDAECKTLVSTMAATNGSGVSLSAELPFGLSTVYYVKEITPPAGYLADNSVQPASFTEPGQVVALTFTDVREVGSLIVKKVNSLNVNQTLAGAEFKLYSDEALKHQVGSAVTTGADGIARFDNLMPGTYWVKETKAPKDYDLFPDAIPVVVAAGVSEPDPIVIKDTYNPPKGYQTGMMDWNFLLIGLAVLLAGAAIVLFTRKRRRAGKHAR